MNKTSHNLRPARRLKPCITFFMALTAIITLAIGNFTQAFAHGTSAASPGREVTVFLDGRQIAFDVPPVILGGRTMVPFRAIFEAFGATMSWDGQTQQVNAFHTQRNKHTCF